MNESSTMMSFAFSGGYLKISLILSRRGLPPEKAKDIMVEDSFIFN